MSRDESFVVVVLLGWGSGGVGETKIHMVGEFVVFVEGGESGVRRVNVRSSKPPRVGRV